MAECKSLDQKGTLAFYRLIGYLSDEYLAEVDFGKCIDHIRK